MTETERRRKRRSSQELQGLSLVSSSSSSVETASFLVSLNSFLVLVGYETKREGGGYHPHPLLLFLSFL